MSEADSLQENPKIPENWSFPERDAPGLKIDQIDLDERFLALNIPDDLPGFSGGSSDYFFDSEGNPREQRATRKNVFVESWKDLYNYIDLAGDRNVDYEIQGNRESVVSGFGEVIVKMGLHRGEESDLTPLWIIRQRLLSKKEFLRRYGQTNIL